MFISQFSKFKVVEKSYEIALLIDYEFKRIILIYRNIKQYHEH